MPCSLAFLSVHAKYTLSLFSLVRSGTRIPGTSVTSFMAQEHQGILHVFVLSINRRDGVVVRAFALQSVDLGFNPFVGSHQKTLKNAIHSFPAWHSEFKGRLWRTSRQARLL